MQEAKDPNKKYFKDASLLNLSPLFNPAKAYKLIDPISRPINNIIKFSESIININPAADISIRITASVVLPSSLLDALQ